jgi:acid phosphatase (class A)
MELLMMSTRLAGAGLVSCILVACATPQLPTTNPADLKPPRPGLLPGYLPSKALADSLALLPPPPAPGTAAQAADEEAYRASRRSQNTPRWQLAEADAELGFPKASATFSCALGVPISAEATPHLNMLLRRTLADVGLATYRAKDHYQRQRPFVAGNDAICTPEDEAKLRKDGSYPSGHASAGWGWALVLAELAPERVDAIVQRGYAFGQSRVVCGVHWQSDVNAGRLVASAVVAQLHANAEFEAQLGEARKEVAAERAAGASPAVDCAAEATALGAK